MALWKDHTTPRKEPQDPAPEPLSRAGADGPAAGGPDPARRSGPRDAADSHIAAGLSIEGSIEGAGHIRVAGRFKGDIKVDGNLTIEAGATVTGAVRAQTVVIAGELNGNIDGATRVDLLEGGVLNGDLKAGSLVVAAGSRMRGQVEFGWEEKATRPAVVRQESLAAS